MWVYFLSLILGIAMTVALLPACGGGGGGSSCNTEANAELENDDLCDAEEDGEEDLQSADEAAHQFREETGDPSSEHIFEDATDTEAALDHIAEDAGEELEAEGQL